MAPNPRLAKAFSAMKQLGITEEKVRPVLRKLLILYDKNWQLIEEGNYRVLVDAIFDEEDNREVETVEDSRYTDELEQPLKRRLRSEGPSSTHADHDLDQALFKRPKVDELSTVNTLQVEPVNEEPLPLQTVDKGSGIGEIMSEESFPSLYVASSHLGEVKVSISCSSAPGRPNFNMPTLDELRKSMEEKCLRSYKIVDPSFSFTNLMKDMCECFLELATNSSSESQEGLLNNMPSLGLMENSSQDAVDVGDKMLIQPSASNESYDIQCSALCDYSQVTEEVILNDDLKSTEEKHLELINENSLHVMPQCVLTLDEFGCIHNASDIIMGEDKPESIEEEKLEEGDDKLESAEEEKREEEEDKPESTEEKKAEEEEDKPESTEEEKLEEGDDKLESAEEEKLEEEEDKPESIEEKKAEEEEDKLESIEEEKPTEEEKKSESTEENKPKGLEFVNGSSLVVAPQFQIMRSILDFNDITKGEEMVNISWENEVNNEFLPYFCYIPQNLVFNSADVAFSLSQIGDENCCSCIGNCLPSCACAYENGGEFAYTSEGLLKDEVLNERISMTVQNQNYLFCEQCPIEKAKNGDMDPCKGHLERKLIKECWKKCACFKKCLNRVVQRGITHKLQVFYTPNGKGWGLRTLEKIAKGAFVCEFVGEILTVKELFERKSGNTDTEKHSFPVLLDAFWVSSGVSKDEEALCLDATCYGNIARFINHRCLDANLIEIPVEVETPDRHYYHLAFFATREIDALEELTWDYGIQFDEPDNLQKAFRCQCDSKFCRNMKGSKSSSANEKTHG
ncbi:hypothetical protein ACFE04_013221 [Oxalis oulophora]